MVQDHLLAQFHVGNRFGGVGGCWIVYEIIQIPDAFAHGADLKQREFRDARFVDDLLFPAADVVADRKLDRAHMLADVIDPPPAFVMVAQVADALVQLAQIRISGQRVGFLVIDQLADVILHVLEHVDGQLFG